MRRSEIGFYAAQFRTRAGQARGDCLRAADQFGMLGFEGQPVDGELVLTARRLSLLKPTAYVVNTARGEVIDENALARMIENNELAGAGLDVFEHEPAVNPKLLRNEKVVVLPHMGSATLEGRVDMGEKVIINIKTFLDGHAPPDRVHPAMF